jgi:hypothetical protein
MKLKRAAYRHIEAEIYAYYDTLQAIRDLRANIFRDWKGFLCPRGVSGNADFTTEDT